MWYMSMCPVCGILTRYYSFRPVVFLGSILLCLGLLLSSFVNDIPVFYLTYGVIFGTGTSLIFMPGIIVLQFCFQKHLATTTGLVTGANSGFTMWYGPVYEYLIRRYGWRATLRIVTCFLIPLAVACALFPSKKQMPSDRDGGSLKVKKSLRRLLKNKVFLIWFLLMTFVYIGIGVPMVHLVSE
jgi:MCP family monocarboxylic acid transporter-like MFS transporter 10